jgi:transposase-like protein
MKRYCVNLDCSEHASRLLGSPLSGRVVKKGTFYRRCDRRYIPRFRCLSCGIQFSKATFDEDYRQHRREINYQVYLLACSSVSQRRAALILGADRKTIQRKFSLLSERAKHEHAEWLDERFKEVPIEHVQFDDLETAEHSKCKPLSVTLAVHAKTREILDFQVKRMPAKGLLTKIAIKKYGYRKDARPEGWDQIFKNLKPLVHPLALFESDENPHYPKYLKRHFPEAVHTRHPGARGAIVGQGELKKTNFDPLFSLNHTCAMLRANLNRLLRRTWCTTKKPEGLIAHLWLYVKFHNQELIRQPL